METEHILNKKRHQNLNRISNSKFKQNLKKTSHMRAFAEVVPSPQLQFSLRRDSDSEFGVELEFRHGFVSFFEFCEHNNHSRSTHVRTTHPARNQSVAIKLSQSNCHNQSVSRNQPESVAISLSQS
jgi:hypothetical protein